MYFRRIQSREKIFQVSLFPFLPRSIRPESTAGNTKFLHGLSGKWSEHLTPYCDQLVILELPLEWSLVLPLLPPRQLPLRRSLQTLHPLHRPLRPSAINQAIPRHLVLQNFIHYLTMFSILWDYLPKPVLQTAGPKQPIKLDLSQDRLILMKTLSLASLVIITSSLVHSLTFPLIIFLIFFIDRSNDNTSTAATVYRASDSTRNAWFR